MIMTKKPETQIIVIREVWYKSLLSDAGTFLTVVGVIGVGWFLGSSAMQWCGFAMLVTSLFALHAYRKTVFTVEQARKRLDEIEAGK
jgi:hypothetical protein